MGTLTKPLGDLVAGNSYAFKLILAHADGNPVDVEGGILFFTLKRSLSIADTAAPLSKSQHQVASSSGFAYMSVTNFDTAKLTAGSYYYDFKFVSKTGTVKTLLPVIGENERKIRVYASPTKRIV